MLPANRYDGTIRFAHAWRSLTDKDASMSFARAVVYGTDAQRDSLRAHGLKGASN